ncbi:restriction endonuclease [Hydrocarboniphaga sp.]|uniref:restriction endonuclease n=1 Tax=Hydrocarboniphaga sp. TaxID=2033016 RepID=UPI003D0F9DC2
MLLTPCAYLGFHWLAQRQPAAPHGISEMGTVLVGTMLKTAGMYGQVLVPLMLVLAALLSWLSKRRRATLLKEAESRTATAPLQALTWREFEQLVGAHFERQGYTVAFTPEGADGGVDVVARKGGETFLVQCKQWRATQVGVRVVRELFGVMAARGATGAYVVSIGSFTTDAKDFAAGRNIDLVDANTLLNPSPKPRLHTAAAETRNAANTSAICPQCGSPMVLRVAKQGTNKGQSFYGCSTYPKCRGVLPYNK